MSEAKPVHKRRSWLRRARLWLGVLISVVTVALLTVVIYHLRQVEAAENLPVAPVRKGDFRVIVRCRGELKARRSLQITAPVNVPELRIVWLAPPGTSVQEGRPVIRFDPSSARQQLQEKQAALEQAQATLDQAVAQARITAEQDKLDLAQARYQVERAKLEASKQEIVSAIQGEESRIDLSLAEKKLRVQEATVALHQASDRAKIASLTRLRDQAQADVDLTNQRLAQMEIKAPLTGVIVYLPNYSQGWVNAKPFKVGDQVWPGGAIGEIPDLNTLEMEGKVDEIDRGRIELGDEVVVRVDALPEVKSPAKLTGISPLTEQSYEWPPTRSFRGYAHISKPDPRMRPGMNGTMDVVVDHIPGAISIPAKALFTYNGKPSVYVANRGRYRRVEVRVLARNPDEVAIEGVAENAMVSLAEPGKKGSKP